MKKNKEYPTPCLREAPTGEGAILEFPGGGTIKFLSLKEGEGYVVTHDVANSYGKVFKQVPGTKRYEELAIDDGS